MTIVDQDTHEPAPASPARPETAHRRRRRVRWPIVALVLGVLLIWPSVSLGRALTCPGNAGLLDRAVEWVRDNGGGGVVDLIENWWYSQGPTARAPDPTTIPASLAATRPSTDTAPAALTTLAGAVPVAGEGVWSAGPPTANGTPALYTTFIRPDPAHPSVVAGVARMDGSRLAFRSVAGTAQPLPDPAQPARVPPELVPTLAATFNSGFKMSDAQGGFYLQGRTVEPLRSGAASLVIKADGSATVGQWGRDVTLGPDVVSVRQNLDLVVEGGQPDPGLSTNADNRWGSAKNQFQYTWRSGIGIDAGGDLIYVGGDHLTLATLGNALAQAQVVTGMELDIHTDKVDFFSYTHDASGAVHATKLLPNIPGPADRYLHSDLRDFFVATLR